VYDRICQRGRSEENSISLEYLKSVHNLHEDWLNHKKFFVPAPVSHHLSLARILKLEIEKPFFVFGAVVFVYSYSCLPFFFPCSRQVLIFDANEDLNAMAHNYALCEDTIFKKVAVAN
jgi:hypothetical protein